MVAGVENVPTEGWGGVAVGREEEEEGEAAEEGGGG